MPAVTPVDPEPMIWPAERLGADWCECRWRMLMEDGDDCDFSMEDWDAWDCLMEDRASWDCLAEDSSKHSL